MIKKTFLLCLLLLCSARAQDLHEFSLYGGFGFSSLRYEPTLGEQSNGLDRLFGFGYAYFFTPRVGLATGLELAFYNAEFKLKNLKMEYWAKDLEEGEEFKFQSTLSNYVESQDATMLQIPLMLHLQTGGKLRFYTLMGAKAGIPISGNRSGKTNVANLGCYDEENYCYGDPKQDSVPQTFRGFGEFKNKKINGKEDFKIAFFASMELGLKWRFDDGLSLYTGAYLDYGLNNILEKRKLEDMPRMVEYNSEAPAEYSMKGMLNSQWEKNNMPQAFVTKIVPMAVGVKVKLAIGQGVDYFAKKEEAEKAPPVVETKHAEEDKKQLEYSITQRMLMEQEAERFATAAKLLQEARLAYENAQREQAAVQMASAEITRLAAEKAQLEREVERLASTPVPAADTTPAAPLPPDTLAQAPVEPPPAVVEAPPAPPAPLPPAGQYIIQVAITLDEARAQSLVSSLGQSGYNAYYKKVSNPGKLTGIYYRIRVGYFNSSSEAEAFAKAKFSQQYRDWWIDRTENDTKSSIYGN